MSRSKLAASGELVHPPISDEATRAWGQPVLLLIGSGVLASAQIGKAIISVPLIRGDMALRSI